MSIFAQLIVVCFAAGSPSADVPASPDDVTRGPTIAAAETFSKLRKIHLVRPDLIAYPLVTDFIC